MFENQFFLFIYEVQLMREEEPSNNKFFWQLWISKFICTKIRRDLVCAIWINLQCTVISTSFYKIYHIRKAACIDYFYIKSPTLTLRCEINNLINFWRLFMIITCFWWRIFYNWFLWPWAVAGLQFCLNDSNASRELIVCLP